MPTFRSKNTCVLIIDDDEDALELSRYLVRKADSSAVIVTACGASEGMDYLLKATSGADEVPELPALVLLDLNMPGTDGFEVLRWVRRNKSLSALKVVMLSSSEAPADIKRASELGAHGYLIKNPNPTVLACMLHQAFSEVYEDAAVHH